MGKRNLPHFSKTTEGHQTRVIERERERERKRERERERERKRERERERERKRERDSHTINCVHENQKQLGGNINRHA